MAEFNFSDFQNFTRPITDLVNGIVQIVETENQEKSTQIASELIDQIYISAVIMHLSELNQAKNIPNAQEIKTLMANNQQTEVVQKFTQGITKDKFLQYLEESATIVMTNYYFQVKDKLTDEKTRLISELQQKIEESL